MKLTDKQIKAIMELQANVARYLPMVSSKISDPALAYSIAKYYPALEKLANT